MGSLRCNDRSSPQVADAFATDLLGDRLQRLGLRPHRYRAETNSEVVLEFVTSAAK